MGLMQFGDKVKGPNKVGSTDLGVKQKGQEHSLVGGGWENQLMQCGTHWVNHNKPPKCGGELRYLMCRAGVLPCSLLQGGVGPTK